jgi:DNA-binding response OmpR family regulator
MKQKNAKILIIDDDPVFQDELKTMLSSGPYKPIICSNKRNILQEVNNSHPDIILLELFLDGVSSFQIIKMLREQEGTSHIPIIPMTGFCMTEEYRLLMKVSGIDSCFIKPFQPEDIFSEIETRLENNYS